MPHHDGARIEFRRLRQVSPRAIIDLMNHPGVRRHLPLSQHSFGVSDVEQFVAAKERMWEAFGYGPWAFVIDDEFIGWGGLQKEADDVEVALVLCRSHWGLGRDLLEQIVSHAFNVVGIRSVVLLLPPSRRRFSAIQRLGFSPDGEVNVAGERFLRFRSNASS